MMKIDPNWLKTVPVQRIMNVLGSAGYKAYFVGGCVRNAVLGETSTDIDISTDALPDQVEYLAKSAGLRSIPTGIDHGTITVVVENIPFEITSFRKDIETDGRRAVVAFSKDITEDAKRRDFTLNAVYADRDGTIVDPLNGLDDLKQRRIRFIDNAQDRIAEDALRILRFFRFYAWYGDADLGIDPEGYAACASAVDKLDGLSRERVGSELRKLLQAPNPAPAIASMARSNILQRCIGPMDAPTLTRMIHLQEDVNAPIDWIARLAALSKEPQKDRLRLSRAEDRYHAELVELSQTQMPAWEAAYRFGADTALQAALIFSASLEQELPNTLKSDLKLGAKVKFPVTAADLTDKFEGPALGAALKKYETDWIQSKFNLSKSKLIR